MTLIQFPGKNIPQQMVLKHSDPESHGSETQRPSNKRF